MRSQLSEKSRAQKSQKLQNHPSLYNLAPWNILVELNGKA